VCSLPLAWQLAHPGSSLMKSSQPCSHSPEVLTTCFISFSGTAKLRHCNVANKKQELK